MTDNLLRIKKAMLGLITTTAIGNSCFYDQSKQGIPFERADGVKYIDDYNAKVDTKGHARSLYRARKGGK